MITKCLIPPTKQVVPSEKFRQTLKLRFNVSDDEFTLYSSFRVLVGEEGAIHVGGAVSPAHSRVRYSKRYTVKRYCGTCRRGGEWWKRVELSQF